MDASENEIALFSVISCCLRLRIPRHFLASYCAFLMAARCLQVNARIRSQADLLFGLINQAHTVLIDKDERAKLDRTLSSSDDTMAWMRSTDYSYYSKR